MEGIGYVPLCIFDTDHTKKENPNGECGREAQKNDRSGETREVKDEMNESKKNRGGLRRGRVRRRVAETEGEGERKKIEREQGHRERERGREGEEKEWKSCPRN